MIDAAPELAALLEACPNLTPARHQPRAAARARRGRVRGAAARRVGSGRAVLRRARSSSPSDDDRRALPAPRQPAAGASSSRRRARRVLSPAQILERLSERLDLLKGGRDADPRQQTLRATIEWSHELLATEEQRLFARLGGLRGGCTLEAAEEVATPTSTRSSRSSRRASSATPTSASGCWRRSASTRGSISSRQARKLGFDKDTPIPCGALSLQRSLS